MMPRAGQLMDLYWGGPERRITGLTVRIIGVNAIALITLVIGILYLSGYQRSLIEAKLETFQSDVEFIAIGFNGADKQAAQETIQKIALTRAFRNPDTGQKRLIVFDKDANMIADTDAIWNWDYADAYKKQELQSIRILKNMANFILHLVPDQKILPPYPDITTQNGKEYPNVPEALNGRLSLSAWQNKDQNRIFLSAATPLINNGEPQGALLFTRDGRDIEREIADVWIDVLRIFLGTLLITILLSIYLSGLIAHPLRKLTRAAENVRQGNASAADIPDFSDRQDEIGELSIVLRDMTRALSDRLHSIESFAADVAHELKNPLTSLKSAVETATRVKKKEDLQKLLDIIKHDVERMDRLISDISAASKLDTELSREKTRPIDTASLLNTLLDSYQGPLERTQNNKETQKERSVSYDNKTITLFLNPAETPHTFGIESRLGQVFANILSNALSFSPENGSITIRAECTPRHITISIEDEGPGIPESKLENIFERFYTERPGHEDYGHHSGLGLAICKQIIEAHHGRIFAENLKQNGKIKGAKFTVILNRI